MKEITNNAGIIKSILAGKHWSDGETPVLLCVVGRSGSGKSRFIQDKVGESFIHVDAGLIYLETGGEAVVEFPEPFLDDVNEIGITVCSKAVAQQLDLVLEFTGADTIHMQVLIRAFEDIGYKVVIKYVSTDLNQATIRNLDDANETVPAQETDPMHHTWLVSAVNAFLPVPAEESSQPSTGLISGLFRQSNDENHPISSVAEASDILKDYLAFAEEDRSVLKDAHTLPHGRAKIIAAVEFMEGFEGDIPDPISVDRATVIQYHVIDAHDRGLLNELDASPSDRDITLRLADESVSESEIEDLELIRAHRERLKAKYEARHVSESEKNS